MLNWIREKNSLLHRKSKYTFNSNTLLLLIITDTIIYISGVISSILSAFNKEGNKDSN